MSAPIITVEHLSKRYHLGQIGATTLRESVERGLHRLRRRSQLSSCSVDKLLSECADARSSLPLTTQQPNNSTTDRASGTTQQPNNSTTDRASGTTQQPNNSTTDRASGTTQQPNNSTTETSPDDLWALRDVSFEVQPGEVLGIIGRNGAGKSTLLKILSRITEPTSGRAIIRGRVASLLEVGTGFHPELTGRENIFLNGAILGMKKAEIARKFDEIVAFAEVERFIDTPVKRYSSGMYVRLAFAVAAHLEPEILILDEVLAVGDVLFQKKCMGKMADVAKQGRTILFVSHNVAAVGSLCRTAMWLQSGAIKGVGPASNVVGEYAIEGTQQGATIEFMPTSQPGNESVRLLAARIRSNGAIGGEVYTNTPVDIEYEYAIHDTVPQLVHCVHLRDKYDVIVFVTANYPSACITPDPAYGQPYFPGIYSTVCTIPDNLLNDDVYTIDVGILDERGKWIVWEKRLLSFRAVDAGEMKREYFGDWVGTVRPKLRWRTEQKS